VVTKQIGNPWRCLECGLIAISQWESQLYLLRILQFQNQAGNPWRCLECGLIDPRILCESKTKGRSTYQWREKPAWSACCHNETRAVKLAVIHL
jgi:DNA-directed RNA polymerase subunit N (RpoN/RPB10)